jgi:transposase
MEKITTVGIDLAKNVFSLHGVDANGKVGLKRTVRLMAPAFVVPYRKSGKNDGNDAEAICEAVARPNMRFVPVKSPEQQAVLALHRVRQGFIEERTALINRLRAVLTEFGVVLPNRVQWVRRDALAPAEALPALARAAVQDLHAHLRLLEERIGAYDRELQAQAQASASAAAQRLMQIRGIGPLTAIAIVTTVGNARDFSSGWQFAAWLGLTPRQHSIGGKPRLGHITRRGDACIRMLLVQGARSVLHTAQRHTDRLSRWALSVQSRRGYHKALVAIAAKNARIAWALLSKQQSLRTV